MLKQPDPLDADALAALLRLASTSVSAALRDADPPGEKSSLESLQRGGGAFVTLRRDGELRGCIGQIAAPPPLWRTVSEMARAAVLDDDRFDRMEPADEDRIEIELSLMTDPFPLRADEIEIGTHGLILEYDGTRALLLPQVAVEHGMDRDAFLDALCRKALLPAGSWREPKAQLWGFRTQSTRGLLSSMRGN